MKELIVLVWRQNIRLLPLRQEFSSWTPPVSSLKPELFLSPMSFILSEIKEKRTKADMLFSRFNCVTQTSFDGKMNSWWENTQNVFQRQTLDMRHDFKSFKNIKFTSFRKPGFKMSQLRSSFMIKLNSQPVTEEHGSGSIMMWDNLFL